MEDERTGDVLAVETIATSAAQIIGQVDGFPRELVYVPEWGKSVWVWAYDVAAEQRRNEFMRGGTEEVEHWELQTRGMISRVAESIRQGGELVAGKLPAPVFSLMQHGDFLRGQPVAVLNLVCQVSQRLNRETLASQEQLAAFFAMLPQVVGCLRHTASACGACTDCPRNSLPTCPSVLYGKLWPQTG